MAITYSNGGAYRLVAMGQWNVTTEVRMIFDLELVTGGTLSAAQGAEDADEFVTNLFTDMNTVLWEGLSWYGCTFDALEGSNVSGFIPLTAPVPGVATTDPLPPGVAMLAFLPTGETRRQMRKFIPGLTEAAIGAFGGFGSGTVSAIAAILADYLLVPFVGTNGTWQYGTYNGDRTPAFAQPTALNVSAIPAYQRRRKQGVGS